MNTNTMQKAAGATNTNDPHTDTSAADFRTGDATGQAPHGNITATQIACLALAGHAVHRIVDGGFLVCKYGYTHHAKDFVAFQAFARKLEVIQ